VARARPDPLTIYAEERRAEADVAAAREADQKKRRMDVRAASAADAGASSGASAAAVPPRVVGPAGLAARIRAATGAVVEPLLPSANREGEVVVESDHGGEADDATTTNEAAFVRARRRHVATSGRGPDPALLHRLEDIETRGGVLEGYGGAPGGPGSRSGSESDDGGGDAWLRHLGIDDEIRWSASSDDDAAVDEELIASRPQKRAAAIRPSAAGSTAAGAAAAMARSRAPAPVSSKPGRGGKAASGGSTRPLPDSEMGSALSSFLAEAAAAEGTAAGRRLQGFHPWELPQTVGAARGGVGVGGKGKGRGRSTGFTLE